MKPRAGDLMECVLNYPPFFERGDRAVITIVRPYVKGEYTYLRHQGTGEIDYIQSKVLKGSFKLIQRKDDDDE